MRTIGNIRSQLQALVIIISDLPGLILFFAILMETKDLTLLPVFLFGVFIFLPYMSFSKFGCIARRKSWLAVFSYVTAHLGNLFLLQLMIFAYMEPVEYVPGLTENLVFLTVFAVIRIFQLFCIAKLSLPTRAEI